MPVPTSYTYETFRSFLENEVLQNVAGTMAWKDDTSSPTVSVAVVGTKAAAARWLMLSQALTSNIPAGTKIRTTTVDGGTGVPVYLTVVNDAYAGETQIFTDTDTGATAYTVNTTLILSTGLSSTTAQDVYNSITNEVLTLMGYSTPESVPADEALRFRALGRVEAWRAVVYNTVTDVDVQESEANLNRSQVNFFASQQLDLAEADYFANFPDPTPKVNRPRATTRSVPVVWRF